jgi:DNA-binding CsgD family transcriptional regulator
MGRHTTGRGINASERARIRALTAATAQFESLPAWLEGTLEAVEQHLGHRRSSLLLVLATPGSSIRRAFAGAVRGWDDDVLAEYFDRWADSDPLGGDRAREMFETRGFARTATLYPELDASRRRFVDEFLHSIDIADQLSLRLAGGGATDGYLTIHEPVGFGESNLAVLLALAPVLTAQLCSYLPRGLAGTLPVRGREVAERIALGFSNREIGEILNIGEDTVKKHVYRAMTALGIQRRTQLAVSWTTGRLLTLPARR